MGKVMSHDVSCQQEEEKTKCCRWVFFNIRKNYVAHSFLQFLFHPPRVISILTHQHEYSNKG